MNTRQMILSLAVAIILAGCASAPSSGSSTDSTVSNVSGGAEIKLTAEGFETSASGVTVQDNILTIAKGGAYVLAGTLENGQVVVDAHDAEVELILKGANLTCPNSAPIYAKDGKLTVTLADGTENCLTDGQNYVFSDGGDEPSAALFSKDNLTINGTGTLKVTGNYQHGIVSKDDLIINNGVLAVTAVADGIRGRDSLTVNSGDITVVAEQDGFQSNNDEDAQKGTVTLNNGTVSITAGNDAIQAETALTVSGGTYTLICGNGSTGSHYEGETSCKGLKAGTALTVAGGAVNIDTLDDAIHSNGTVDVTGGTLSISTDDDAVHGDGAVTVSGGDITVLRCYEGLEGLNITMSDGTVHVTASDDGVNAADPAAQEGPGAAMPHQNRALPAQMPAGTPPDGEPAPMMDRTSGDGSAPMMDRVPGGRQGGSQGNPGTTNENIFIRVTGGRLVVDAQGDALDSNGQLYLEGGVVLLNGPTGQGDGALDYDGTCAITGGTFIAAGSAGMAQVPGEADSTQPTLMVYFTEQQPGGTTVSFTTQSGDCLAAFTPTKAFQTIVFSSPALQTGDAIIVSTGGTGDSDADGYTQTWSGGEQLTTATLSSTVTRINQDGSAVTGGMGRMGGMPGGGMRGRKETALP